MMNSPSSPPDFLLSLDAFVRAVGIKKTSPHAMFLGAGASISSGIPSAANCVWEWKRDIFLSNNPGLEDQFAELSLSSVKKRIQVWLDGKGGYPPADADEEYSHYIEKCYPLAENRRAYFQTKIQAAKPHVGYQLLCALAEAEIIRSVWTTNFDSLTARAAANFQITPVEAGMDCQQRVFRQPTKGELVSVALHGDYRYDPLKNTSDEIRQQEEKLRQALIDLSQDTSLIVCGYSGRDHSIMDAFTAAYSGAGTGTLYWCGYGDEVPDAVGKLLAAATRAGRTAYFVPTSGFDDVMSRLARFCLTQDQRKQYETILSKATELTKFARSKFSVPAASIGGIIKSNAFEIVIPSEVLSLEIQNWPAEKVWEWVQQVAQHGGFVAVPYRKKLPPTNAPSGSDGFLRRVLAFGLPDRVREAFAANAAKSIERTPIGEEDIRHDDSAMMSLLLRTVVKALADKHGLDTDGRNRLSECSSYETKSRNGKAYHIHRSVVLFLRRTGDTLFLVLKPSVEIRDGQGAEVPKDEGLPVKMEVFGWQHNHKFNEELDRWRMKLVPDRPTVIEFPPNCASSFRFTVTYAPALAEIRDSSLVRDAVDVSTFRKHMLYAGMVVKEPPLRFVRADGTATSTDSHPLRGLLKNRPFDFSLTQKGLASQIRIGVICPRAESRILADYLQRSSQVSKPAATESDYLLEFPGFEKAFHVPLEIPQPGANGWEECPEIVAASPEAGSRECAEKLVRCINHLEAGYKPDVVVIFVPERWRQFRRFETETDSFDLHDFVKAYCVQKGMSSQFLEQHTLSLTQQCRIWWWLSLAFYVKAMRTPWVLDSLAADTAFVGIGHSIDRHAERGKQITLGCSHLYNAQGEGLQFRLSQIESPTWINRNPHMSKDDAYRVGETIRQLFFEAYHKIPSRIVLHKLTPFLRDERDGLREGLNGISNIDMIEITVENAMRYVASVVGRNGALQQDTYPVRRGTVIQLDEFSALLWIHGATGGLQGNRPYFQGKRRIPAPTLIRRHAGTTDLAILAAEILGLSKMNWNSADLYSHLPATVDSSKQIAQLGALLDRFGPMSYDYRLFI